MKRVALKRMTACAGQIGVRSHLRRSRWVLIPIYLFITIMGVAVRHPQLMAQEVPSQAPASAALPDGPSSDQVSSSVGQYPVAQVVPGARLREVEWSEKLGVQRAA